MVVSSIRVVAISSLLVSFWFSGCQQRLGESVSRQVRFEDGWIDDHAIRVFGQGSLPAGETNPAKRKAISQERAILAAQRKVLEFFSGSRVQSSNVTNPLSHETQRKLQQIIRTGSVKKISWEKDTQDCSVIYEVSQRNLKKTVFSLE